MRLISILLVLFCGFLAAQAEESGPKPITQVSLEDVKKIKSLVSDYFYRDTEALECMDIKNVWHRVVVDENRAGDELRVYAITKYTCDDRQGVFQFETCQMAKYEDWMIEYCDQ